MMFLELFCIAVLGGIDVLAVIIAVGGVNAIGGLVIALFFILTVMVLKLFLCEIKGYQIDLQNRILWAPPGKSFGLSREYINIDDIQQISEADHATVSSNGHVSRSYKLQIIGAVGTFGTRRYIFKTEHKRDELYSAIVELNGMGTPIV